MGQHLAFPGGELGEAFAVRCARVSTPGTRAIWAGVVR
jgi:hypothetical protein